MVRRPRVEIEGGLYHVYNRVASGEPIFADPNEGFANELNRLDGMLVAKVDESLRKGGFEVTS